MLAWFKRRSRLIAERNRLREQLALERRLRQDERESYESQLRAAVESLDRIAQSNAYDAAVFRGAREISRQQPPRIAG